MDWAAFFNGLKGLIKEVGVYFAAFAMVIVCVWKGLDALKAYFGSKK